MKYLKYGEAVTGIDMELSNTVSYNDIGKVRSMLRYQYSTRTRESPLGKYVTSEALEAMPSPYRGAQ